MPNLQDLPLPLAIIVAAFYVIQQSNAAATKQLIVLLATYDALFKTVSEDRKESRERWIERDRLLNERLDRNTIAQEKSANETHALRNVLQKLVNDFELLLHAGGTTSASRRGSKPDGTD